MEYKVTQKIAETEEEKPSFIIDYDKPSIKCPICGNKVPLKCVEGICQVEEVVAMKCSNCGHEKP